MHFIRKAGKHDLDSIARIEENAFADNRRKRSIAMAVYDGLCYISAVDGADAGFITVDRVSETECHIGLVAVADVFRRKGVATGLIEHMMSQYPGRRVYGTTVRYNTHMQNVFKKAGFGRINTENSAELVFKKIAS